MSKIVHLFETCDLCLWIKIYQILIMKGITSISNKTSFQFLHFIIVVCIAFVGHVLYYNIILSILKWRAIISLFNIFSCHVTYYAISSTSCAIWNNRIIWCNSDLPLTNSDAYWTLNCHIKMSCMFSTLHFCTNLIGQH